MPSAIAASSSPSVQTSRPFLADDDRGAGVLAHRQHAAGGDVGVLQQIVGDELVVGGRLGIVEDLRELGEMAGAQQMVDVDHRLFGEQPQRLALDDQHLAPHRPLDPHALAGELAIRRRLVRAELETEWRWKWLMRRRAPDGDGDAVIRQRRQWNRA